MKWFKLFHLEHDEIFSFGENDYGQLGIGEINNQHKPQLVSFFKQMKSKQICSGDYHSLILIGKFYLNFNF